MKLLETHLVHTDAAGVLEYVPTLQFVHTRTLLAPMVTEFLPATQPMHVETVVAPTVPEYVPASQFVQDAFPGEILYFPEVQVVQVAPFAPVYPALHVQSLTDVHGLQKLPDEHSVHIIEPASENLPESQFKHVETAVAPTVTEYLPDTQLVHTDSALDPVVPEYLPAPQLVHELAPAAEYVPAPQFVHTLETDAPLTT
jgi:hypothetical protein